MTEQNQPWYGTASLAGNTPDLRSANDDARTRPRRHPSPADALLRDALDTSIRFGLEQLRQRAESSRPTPPEPQP